MLVCLDTMVAIWAIRKMYVDKGDEYRLTEADEMLEYLENSKARIIIPSVVFGEMMIPLDGTERLQLQQRMKGFMLGVYDAVAAARYSQVWQASRVKPLFPDYKGEDGERIRYKLKADSMIIATGLRYKVDVIVTEDKNLKKLAQGLIMATSMKNLPKPLLPSPGVQLKMDDLEGAPTE